MKETTKGKSQSEQKTEICFGSFLLTLTPQNWRARGYMNQRSLYRVTNVFIAGYVGNCGNVAKGHRIHVRVAEKLPL